MANYCSQCGKQITPGTEFCTHCGHSLHGKPAAPPRAHEKRRKFLDDSAGRTRKRTPYILLCLGIAVVGMIVYSKLPVSGNALLRAQPVVAPGATYPASGQQMVPVASRTTNGKIVIPLDLVVARKIVAFSFDDAGTSVPLLAYVSGDGRIVTAVSMCEPCNSQKFHIRGTSLVCNACGTRWNMNTMAVISGSCGKYPPDVLPNTIAGNDIQIDEQLVATWQRRI